MSLDAELQGLSYQLAGRSNTARAVMVVPVLPGAGASHVCARLARLAAAESGRPVWLYDLAFSENVQASRTALNGLAYSADFANESFWNAEPHGSARLILRKSADLPVFVTRFERQPGLVRRVTFARAPGYWNAVRRACGLALVDSPADSPAIGAMAADMDGVILVADAHRCRRSDANRAADRIEDAGGRVLGVVVNRSGAHRGAQ